MPVRVGINGFGRIGRLVLRSAMDNKNVEFVGINDLVPPENLAYLLKYDSILGRFEGEVTADADSITANGHKIRVFEERDPANLPWGEVGADIGAAERQLIGNGLNFSGPLVGLFATRDKDVRQMPGRLAGETVDAGGRRG